MDPNTTLTAFRSAVRRWQEAAVADASDDRYAAALDAVEAAIQLDRWLSRGGFLPAAWRTAPMTREVER